MLTISTETKTLYINIDLLKSKLKKAVITLLKISTTIITIAGIVWIIGTAGASDNNTIPYTIFTSYYADFTRLFNVRYCMGIKFH